MELYTYARLTPKQLDKVKAFEDKTGKQVLILGKASMEAADLSAKDLEALQVLETELGLIGVAIK